MRSMTGYGSGRGTVADGTPCAVEIQSVNRKQAELLLNLPRDLSSLEPRAREIINAQVARGRFVVNVTLQARPAGTGADMPPPALDVAAAARVLPGHARAPEGTRRGRRDYHRNRPARAGRAATHGRNHLPR